jgi:hypothetical protein
MSKTAISFFHKNVWSSEIFLIEFVPKHGINLFKCVNRLILYIRHAVVSHIQVSFIPTTAHQFCMLFLYVVRITPNCGVHHSWL